MHDVGVILRMQRLVSFLHSLLGGRSVATSSVGDIAEGATDGGTLSGLGRCTRKPGKWKPPNLALDTPRASPPKAPKRLATEGEISDFTPDPSQGILTTLQSPPVTTTTI